MVAQTNWGESDWLAHTQRPKSTGTPSGGGAGFLHAYRSLA